MPPSNITLPPWHIKSSSSYIVPSIPVRSAGAPRWFNRDCTQLCPLLDKKPFFTHGTREHYMLRQMIRNKVESRHQSMFRLYYAARLLRTAPIAILADPTWFPTRQRHFSSFIALLISDQNTVFIWDVPMRRSRQNTSIMYNTLQNTLSSKHITIRQLRLMIRKSRAGRTPLIYTTSGYQTIFKSKVYTKMLPYDDSELCRFSGDDSYVKHNALP